MFLPLYSINRPDSDCHTLLLCLVVIISFMRYVVFFNTFNILTSIMICHFCDLFVLCKDLKATYLPNFDNKVRFFFLSQNGSQDNIVRTLNERIQQLEAENKTVI
jgi:hypothetical protein